MHYRIKIEERNNGEKEYIPQVKKVKLKIGKFDILSTGWHNVIEDRSSFWAASFAQVSYDTEQKAISIIEGYMQYLIDQKGREIKRTTYKTIGV